MHEVIELLGARVDSAPIQHRLHAIGESAEVFDDGIDLYHSFPGRGLTFVFRQGRLDSVMFYSEGRDDFSQYVGTLPFGLCFEDNGEAVREKVGREISASGVRVPFPGRSESNWIKFAFENWTLHVEFKSLALDAISLVTVAMRGVGSN